MIDHAIFERSQLNGFREKDDVKGCFFCAESRNDSITKKKHLVRDLVSERNSHTKFELDMNRHYPEGMSFKENVSGVQGAV